jgi:NOL1/NOP2/fmu family ribosome biogenesis protein
MSAQTETKGRIARTKGLSMLPSELEEAQELEELTGMGLSEIFHRQFAPQLHAAVLVLRDAKESGMELNRARLRTEWVLGMSPIQIRDIYTRTSELVLGG